ncbi:MAG TPA: hypothetical protein VFP32_02535 [Candidatus Saccharimonadales bacterium]|nr:hypothetical protein [Candidatus Saccharimonadales bacterium]
MPFVNKKQDFFESEEGVLAAGILAAMADSSAYNTAPSYSSNTETYPDNLIPFIDKHMNYLKSYPSVDPQKYLANLRLITKIKKTI